MKSDGGTEASSSSGLGDATSDASATKDRPRDTDRPPLAPSGGDSGRSDEIGRGTELTDRSRELNLGEGPHDQKASRMPGTDMPHPSMDQDESKKRERR
jgi:hypothetical protein